MTGTLRRALRPSGLLFLVLAPLVAGCDAAPTGPAPEGAIVAIGIQPSDSRNSGGVTVSPGEVELVAGATVRLVALDASGNSVNPKWSSSNASVASVAGDGTVLGVARGVSTVTAKVRGSSAAATVRIVQGEAQPPAASPAWCRDLPRDRTVAVASTAELEAALRNARAGDVIELADGTYAGRFAADASGTAERPIVLCGTAAAALDGGSHGGGVGFRLKGSHWVLDGFTVTRSLSGIILQGAHHSTLRRVRVHSCGHEAVHFGWNSTHNTLEHSVIYNTGLETAEYGEGVYVGSYNGHWCARTGCQPDRSDHNRIVNNVIGPDVRSEHVDVKEGTTGGSIVGNTLHGSGMVQSKDWVDSWVEMKGNDWLVAENRGTGSIRDGFQVFRQIEGWGNRNVFRDNVADVQAEGYGFRVGGGTSGNRIECTNKAQNAGSGLSNVGCAT